MAAEVETVRTGRRTGAPSALKILAVWRSMAT
jgi:hypothetical protein